MGIYYFLVCPKLKVIFCLGKSMDFQEDEIDDFNKDIERWKDRIERKDINVDEWTLENLQKQRLKELLEVVTFYDEMAWRVLDYKYKTMIFIAKIRDYDKNAYIISDVDKELNKLSKKYKTLQEGDVDGM